MKVTNIKVPEIEVNSYDKIYHMSHVDMDGFACSMVMAEATVDGRVHFINAQYGNGVQDGVDELVRLASNRDGKILVIVTDLGLTYDQCVQLDTLMVNDVDVRVVDHHPVHDSIKDSFEWYFQDKGASATALLYDALVGYKEHGLPLLESFVRAVSAYDTFNRDDLELFATGNAINNGMYSFMDKLQSDKQYTRQVVTTYLKQTAMFIREGVFSWSPVDIESQVSDHWRTAVRAKGNDTIIDTLIRKLSNDVIEDKSNRYNVELSNKMYKCAIIENLSFVSMASYEILHDNRVDIDFVISVNKEKGTVSVRSKEAPANLLAQAYFEGWGHEFAAGGKTPMLRCDDLIDTLKTMGFVKVN